MRNPFIQHDVSVFTHMHTHMHMHTTNVNRCVFVEVGDLVVVWERRRWVGGGREGEDERRAEVVVCGGGWWCWLCVVLCSVLHVKLGRAQTIETNCLTKQRERKERTERRGQKDRLEDTKKAR